MPSLPSVPMTTYQLPLNYAASWTFAYYAPYPHMGLSLAFEEKTKCFIICQYLRSKKCWYPLGTFTLDKDTHAYLDDNKMRMRVLGWRDPWKREDTRMYFDLQFAEEDGLQSVKNEMIRFIPAPIVEGNSLFSSEQMIDIFRKVPEMAAYEVPKGTEMGCKEFYYFATSSRHYRPELACPDDESVAYEETKLETGDVFDAWTLKNERFEDNEERAGRQDRGIQPAAPKSVMPGYELPEVGELSKKPAPTKTTAETTSAPI